jgi:perosamine synthetase
MITQSKPCLGKDDVEAIKKVIESGQIASGPMVKKFEAKLSRFIGVRGGVATNSGTSALHLALIALGIKEGDEVIMPSYVCTALLNTVNYVHGKPVLADINLDDFNISVSEIKKKIGKRTRAIIVPHMFGLAADVDEITDLGAHVIEDCAQSIGAEYKNKKVGNFGALSVFSFYATKMMTTGEGGMVLSNSGKILETLRDLREYDFKQNYKIRYNYKMTDMQAALGLNQLSKLLSFIKKRIEIAKFYNDAFSDLDVVLPSSKKYKKHVFFRYVVRVKKNVKKCSDELRKKGVICDPPVFKPLHCYLGLNGKQFPNTEKTMNSAISIPIYPSISIKKMETISNIVRSVLK